MTQLLLDLERPPVPTFDNFVVGRNAEALAAVRAACDASAAGRALQASQRCLYLWGDVASGRSHLLRAACNARGSYLRGPDASPDDLRDAIDAAADIDKDAAPGAPARPGPVFAFDDVERAAPATQEALFHAINRLREDPRAVLIVSGAAAPRDLALAAGREDLRSRLAWGLVYRLHRLDDDEKDAALARHADAQRFPLTPDVRRYLLTHFARDLSSLMQVVHALDRHARETQRVVTVRLIREFQQRAIEFGPVASDDRNDRAA